MDASTFFRDKRITVMGINPEGRGVQDAIFLAEHGAQVTVTDTKEESALAESVERLRVYENISFTLGGHQMEDFQNKDLIIRAASVPLGSPYLEEARKNGIDIKTDETLFLSLAPHIVTIGITGTRGKSTVTHMVFDILQAAEKRSYLGGNVRGKATLPLLREVHEGDSVVFELDSWKLQGFGEARLSPNIAVFTTFLPDHMNYYKNDMGAYLADKANIFLYQHADDTLVLGKQCAPIVIEKYGEQIVSNVVVVNELKLPDTWTLRMPGIHNRYNAALALAAVRSLGVSDEISRKALETFKGVPGRLELVREVRGIKIYNDTTATTPSATVAALAALDPARTVLIMGGSDKGLDMDDLVEKLPAVKKIVLLAGTGTERIKEYVPDAVVYDDFQNAIETAFASTEPGDCLLLSPAFASFGMFKNEFDRGDQFNTIIQSL